MSLKNSRLGFESPEFHHYSDDTLIPKGTTVLLVALMPSEWFESNSVSSE
jgi:hypothetical protein